MSHNRSNDKESLENYTTKRAKLEHPECQFPEEMTSFRQASDMNATANGTVIPQEESTQDVSGEAVKSSGESSKSKSTAARSGTEKGESMQKANTMETTSGREASDEAVSAGKIKGKGESDHDAKPTDLTSADEEHIQRYASQFAAQQPDAQYQTGDQEATAGASSEIPPNMETVSISASSFSNPTLEVDSGDGVRCLCSPSFDDVETKKLIHK